MIILDSNILKGTSLRGPEAELIRAIRVTRAERVAAPWIVLEELAAQQALIYQKKYDAALVAMEALRKATPWAAVQAPKKAVSEHVRAHWRKQYAAIVDTLPTSPDTYEQAMFREANLLAPCKTVNSGKNKTGSRDAAIWLTAVEYARRNPTEIVYFVSNNTEDFGDGSSFESPMDDDLEGIEDRFVLFTSLSDVLTKFATQTKADEEELTGLLQTHLNNHRAVQRAAMRQRGFTATIESPPSVFEDVPCRRWERQLRIKFVSVEEIRAYEISGHRWYTATARWLVSGVLSTSTSFHWGHCSWETRVLISPTAPSKGLTVTVPRKLLPPTAEDLFHIAPYPFLPGILESTLSSEEQYFRRALGTGPLEEDGYRRPYPGDILRQETIRKVSERYRAEQTDDMLPMDE
ncbi:MULTISPECIES: PIN domain-containing protein [unclassified Streptomyces]|uniref:PIN domain-containing protein n=1 Tax=unclassified Streptomyces TaxID=2593676 RepID=UPI002E1CD81B|nr:PIN domain-containing protein [Streptomyces sp. NBC_01014]WSX71412.1 PIN domain-containing protein [Streptomyces sp. NBC_00932]